MQGTPINTRKKKRQRPFTFHKPGQHRKKSKRGRFIATANGQIEPAQEIMRQTHPPCPRVFPCTCLQPPARDQKKGPGGPFFWSLKTAPRNSLKNIIVLSSRRYGHRRTRHRRRRNRHRRYGHRRNHRRRHHHHRSRRHHRCGGGAAPSGVLR